MNFGFTDDQQAIKRTARDFLEARYKLEVVRQLAESERGFTDEEWGAVAELGWPGVMIPEEHGGLGLGAVELVVIEEELGYALAPTPLLSSVGAALLLEAAGSAEQRERWLPRLASGEARGALATWDEGAGWSPAYSIAELDNGTLTATKIAVADAATADILVVSGAGGSHFLVDAGAAQRERFTVEHHMETHPSRIGVKQRWTQRKKILVPERDVQFTPSGSHCLHAAPLRRLPFAERP